MLSKTVEAALNQQLQMELASSYIYLAMSACLEARQLPGMAHWMVVQHKEEHDHAAKFVEYLVDQGARVELEAIDKPPMDYKSALDVFEKAYAHEQKVSASIRKIFALARKEDDYATEDFLSWFVKEQVEEEKNAVTVVDRLKIVGDSLPGLLMLDEVLGKR
jgi:ferritin